MALKVTFENTQEIILSDNYKGILSPCHGVYYLFKTGKLGEVTEGAGKTPREAINDRYDGRLSANDKNIEIAAYFVFDKDPNRLRQYDNSLRESIDNLHKRGAITFGACHLGNRIDNQNNEALLNFNVTQDLSTLIECVKSHHGISQHFNTRIPFLPRYGQLDAISEITDILLKNNKCLFAAYTGYGKTLIGLVSVLRYFSRIERGGLVLVTTPIPNTLNSFMRGLDDIDVGENRNQKYSYITVKDWNSNTLEGIKSKTKDGEVVFLLLTAQDLFYDDKNDNTKIRGKYNKINGNIDLWIRDEGHKFYRGERTSTLLDCLKASAILDLSATPYNFLDTYDKDTIVNRDFLWGSKNREHTGLPESHIESYETPFSGLSDNIKALYDVEEGYDPRKWFVRDDNGAYIYIEDIAETYRRKYEEVLPKKRNNLNVNLADKRVSLDVLPSGVDGDGAADKYPNLAKVLNQRIKTRHFIDAWSLDKMSEKTKLTLEQCVDKLLEEHSAVNILTCRKFTTGTDIPQISHINLFDKISSPTELSQLIGRMLRIYKDKNQVRLYNHCPGNQIELALGIAARKSSTISGESLVEYLDSIPFTKYPLNSTKPKLISAQEIISLVQEYYESISSPRPNTSVLNKVLLEIDESFFDTIDLKRLGKYGNTCNKKGVKLNEKNNSKVKHIIPSGVGVNPTDETIITVRNLLSAIGTEMVWVSYTHKTYDVMEVLDMMQEMGQFSDYQLNIARSILMHKCSYNFFTKFLEEKREAYSGRPYHEVHDSVFIDTKAKRDMGLVYIPIQLAYDLVLDKEIQEEYNKGKRNFLVVNALSGSIPYLLSQKYPDVNIFCAEYYPYFKKHLKNLIPECQVVDITCEESKKLLTLSEYKDMKFDVVLANPPYQSNDGNGELKGSGTGALWWKISELSRGLLKDNGLLSFMTPTNILNGGDQFTSAILGKKRKLDLKKVITSINESYFPHVGTKICRWVAYNTVTKDNIAIVNNTLEINTDTTFKIYDDKKVQDIIQTLIDYDSEKFDISVRDTADPRAVSKMIQKEMGMSKVDADKYVRDYRDTQSDEYPYAINSNGKIKYGKVKWITYGKWKMMIPHMGKPFKYEIIVSDTIVCDQSCDVQYFDNEEDALKAKEILDDPFYRWVIEQTRVGGRLSSAILSRLPNTPITKVLTSNQIDYIQSQL